MNSSSTARVPNSAEGVACRAVVLLPAL